MLLTLPGDRVGYLHGGAVHTVQLLPRTNPAIALDGAVLVIQPDTGAWWTLTGDAAPTSVTPEAPPGAGAVDTGARGHRDPRADRLAPGRDRTRRPRPLIVAGYDRATGELIATTTTPAGAVGRGTARRWSGTTRPG